MQKTFSASQGSFNKIQIYRKKCTDLQNRSIRRIICITNGFTGRLLKTARITQCVFQNIQENVYCKKLTGLQLKKCWDESFCKAESPFCNVNDHSLIYKFVKFGLLCIWSFSSGFNNRDLEKVIYIEFRFNFLKHVFSPH